MATTFLFWNVKRKPLAGLVATLADEHRADVVLLAEWDPQHDHLLRKTVARCRKRSYTLLPDAPVKLERRVRALVGFPKDRIARVADRPHHTSWHVRLPAAAVELSLLSVHARSGVHGSGSADALAVAQHLAKGVSEMENLYPAAPAVLVGDFNLDPFDVALVAANGLHGVSDPHLAAKEHRTVHGERYPFLLNPTWRLVGGTGSGAPLGTYFYRAGGRHHQPYWHVFDQVLIRPALVPRFHDRSLRVLTRAGPQDLATPSGRPSSRFSDHFPIVFGIDLHSRRDDG